jgi:thioredoxin 1
MVAQAFDTPITTSDQSVDRVLAAGLPIALIFLDGFHHPALDPVMERLARENVGKLLVVKVNVKDSPGVTRLYQVARPPAIVILRNGETLAKADAISGADLESHVAYLLGHGPRPVPAQTGPGPASAPRGSPVIITDATFDQDVLKSKEPVLVDVWAPWCGPCRMVEPVVEKLAQENAGRLRVAKVNADENPQVITRYGIQICAV